MSISTTKRDLAKLTIKKKSWDTVKDTKVVRDRLASPAEDVKNEIDSLKKLIKLEKSQKTIKDFTIRKGGKNQSELANNASPSSLKQHESDLKALQLLLRCKLDNASLESKKMKQAGQDISGLKANIKIWKKASTLPFKVRMQEFFDRFFLAVSGPGKLLCRKLLNSFKNMSLKQAVKTIQDAMRSSLVLLEKTPMKVKKPLLDSISNKINAMKQGEKALLQISQSDLREKHPLEKGVPDEINAEYQEWAPYINDFKACVDTLGRISLDTVKVSDTSVPTQKTSSGKDIRNVVSICRELERSINGRWPNADPKQVKQFVADCVTCMTIEQNGIGIFCSLYTIRNLLFQQGQDNLNAQEDQKINTANDQNCILSPSSKVESSYKFIFDEESNTPSCKLVATRCYEEKSVEIEKQCDVLQVTSELSIKMGDTTVPGAISVKII